MTDDFKLEATREYQEGRAAYPNENCPYPSQSGSSSRRTWWWSGWLDERGRRRLGGILEEAE
ncbi:ribosome modulation factor [Porticoccus sp.]